MYILGGKELITGYDYSSENVRLVSYVALNCKTLEGFAGVMRKYCSQRTGPIFTEVFKQLLVAYDDGNDNDDDGSKIKIKKFLALLTNQIPTTTTTKSIHDDMNEFYSHYFIDGQLASLRQFIDEKEVDNIQLQNPKKILKILGSRKRERLIVHCHGISLLEDRQSNRKRTHRYVLF